MIFNVDMKIASLLENEEAVKIFDTYMPGMRTMVEKNPQASSLSLSQIVKYAHIPHEAEMLQKMNEELNVLNTPENAVSPSEREMMEKFQQIAKEGRTPEQEHHQSAIYPGKPWLDTNGRRIQAHGGGVFYEDGMYYWYGENKEHTDGKNGVWTWGIRYYSSKDLYNWRDEGYLIKPDLTNPNSAMFPCRHIDRPHILKCDRTGKYVCWIKLSGAEAAFTIWQSDTFSGPYEMVENLYRPGGYKAGDFDLVKDEKNGNGYIFFDADHTCMMGMKLTEDYLHVEKVVSKSYENKIPPFTREGPAVFEAQGKKYMITSGMTGYVPNQSDCAVSDNWEETFQSIGNPHINDSSNASFNSQISKIFKIEGKDRWIAMADRWLPQYPVDARIADLFTRVIAGSYDPEHYHSTDAEKKEMYKANVLESANTSIADYVWLPIQFINGKPVISWKDQWIIEDEN